jgi:GNAT superfamily N-acetyltransferase
LELEIYRVDNSHKKRVWDIFSKYHYLNNELHAASLQYVGILNGELVCHTGLIQFPMQKGKKRVHRLVVLPDYQGIGIGTAFISKVAELIDKSGYEVNLTTTTPALVGALKRNPHWILARYGRAKENFKRFQNRYGLELKHLDNQASGKRITYSFWYKR